MKEKIFKSSDKIYFFHNNMCSKSREVKKYLDENNFDEIIRINEKTFKTLKIDEKTHTFETVMNLVIKYPILMKRLIVAIERDNEIIKSIICRPTELIKSIFY